MAMTDSQVDEALRAERKELDVLLEKGIEFTLPIVSLLRLFSRKKLRTFLIKQPFLGTLDRLSAEFIQMDFSESRIKADPLGESKQLIAKNARRCARVVAIAVLNGQWKIKLLTPFFAQYVLWRTTPQKLFELTMLITTISNITDFTASIRYLSVSRTTMPVLMEEPADQQD